MAAKAGSKRLRRNRDIEEDEEEVKGGITKTG